MNISGIEAEIIPSRTLNDPSPPPITRVNIYYLVCGCVSCDPVVLFGCACATDGVCRPLAIADVVDGSSMNPKL